MKFAADKGFSGERFNAISLGQGQVRFYLLYFFLCYPFNRWLWKHFLFYQYDHFNSPPGPCCCSTYRECGERWDMGCSPELSLGSVVDDVTWENLWRLVSWQHSSGLQAVAYKLPIWQGNNQPLMCEAIFLENFVRSWNSLLSRPQLIYACFLEYPTKFWSCWYFPLRLRNVMFCLVSSDCASEWREDDKWTSHRIASKPAPVLLKWSNFWPRVLCWLWSQSCCKYF